MIPTTDAMHPFLRDSQSPELELSGLPREELEDYAAQLADENRSLIEFCELFQTAMTDGFWDWHLEEDFEYMSPRFWEIFGYSAEQKRHHPSEWQELIHPEDLQAALVRFDEHVSSKGATPYDLLVRYRHAHGHWVTVRCVGRVVEWSNDSRPLRMVGTHSDVTDLVKARSHLELIYQDSTVGVWDWPDTRKEEVIWSARLYELLGYGEGAFPVSMARFRELIHPEDVEPTFEQIDSEIANKSMFDVEFRVRCSSGDYRWFHSVGRAVGDERGESIQILGTFQDVHERRAAEEDLLQLHVRHELSLAASNIGVWDWDVVNDVLVWDDQMYILYGIAKDQFSSAYEAWYQGLHPDDKEAGDKAIRASLEGDAPFDTSFRVIWPSSEIRTIRAIATVVRDEAGNPLRLVGANWDVTEESRTQAALERRNDDLSQFAYRTSHDLKAPLLTIQGLVKLVISDLESGDQDTVRDNVDRIDRQAARLEALVNGILSVSRSDLQETELVSVSIHQVLDELWEEIDDLFPNSPVRIERRQSGNFDEPIPAVRLRQILVNLITNGIVYANQERADPWVGVAIKDEGSSISLKVSDNGLGIPEEFHSQIFQVFQRFHADLAAGTGLGLAIVNRHVQRLHGQIEFESSPEGTSFSILLPYR